MVERLLGLTLEKGHSAADWSTRPLPRSWLAYAALDVEVLVELRDLLEAELAAAGKLDWAREEFAAVAAAPPPPPRAEPWRRTSGIHRVRGRRALAVVRELWEARDALARQRDIAPGRVLPDSAIVGRRGGRPGVGRGPVAGCRSSPAGSSCGSSAAGMARWRRRARLPDAELPLTAVPSDGAAAGEPVGRPGPGRRRPAGRGPGGAGRAVGAALDAGGEPARRRTWSAGWPGRRPRTARPAAVAAALAAGGARPWQVDLAAAPLAVALAATADTTAGDTPGSPPAGPAET